MPCDCEINDSEVINSRPCGFFIWRRRQCKHGRRFTTYELAIETHQGASKRGIPTWVSGLRDLVETVSQQYQKEWADKRRAARERKRILNDNIYHN